MSGPWEESKEIDYIIDEDGWQVPIAVDGSSIDNIISANTSVAQPRTYDPEAWQSLAFDGSQQGRIPLPPTAHKTNRGRSQSLRAGGTAMPEPSESWMANDEECANNGRGRIVGFHDGENDADDRRRRGAGGCCSLRCFIVLLVILVAGFGVILLFRDELDDFLPGIGSGPKERLRVPQNITVGVYYYPWHDNDFHNGQGYLRAELDPPQQPELGEYDDTDPAVISQHFEWSRQANVQVWITSWWGPSTDTDTTTRQSILGHPEIDDIQIALHYETNGRLKNDGVFTSRQVTSDIEFMCAEYFDHPNYYRIDGRAVLVIYLSRSLQTSGDLERTVLLMRSAADKCGHPLYVIGDHTFGIAPRQADDYLPFQYLDAVTNFDSYGRITEPGLLYADTDRIDRYYDRQFDWREAAHQMNCAYIPGASPGYNDRAVRLEEDHRPLSRQLTPQDDYGSFFWYSLQRARDLVDPRTEGLLLINSFNEWHEDTQIEPVRVVEQLSDTPDVFTQGVPYQGYGELYLDLLANATDEPALVFP